MVWSLRISDFLSGYYSAFWPGHRKYTKQSAEMYPENMLSSDYGNEDDSTIDSDQNCPVNIYIE